MIERPDAKPQHANPIVQDEMFLPGEGIKTNAPVEAYFVFNLFRDCCWYKIDQSVPPEVDWDSAVREDDSG